VGFVSGGWQSGATASNAVSLSSCINTTITNTATCDASLTTITATFAGGESSAGIAPTTGAAGSDIFDAQLEVDVNDKYTGTVSATTCTASASLAGVFSCTGLTPDMGYECAASGQAPVGSLTSSTATFVCVGAGAVAGIFAGGNYAAGAQPSVADIAYVSAFSEPAVVAPLATTFYPAVGAGMLASYCYVTATNTVSCYGYTPAAGYACASATNAAPQQCAAGTFTAAGAACAPCPAGSTSSAGASACTALVGYAAVNGVVSGCAVNYTASALTKSAAWNATSSVCTKCPSPASSPGGLVTMCNTSSVLAIANPVAVVKAAVALVGLTVAQFTPSVQTAFVSSVASLLAVNPADVAITSVTAYSGTAAAAGRRRRLLQTGVNVEFTVNSASATQTANLTSAVSSITSGAGSAMFVSTLQAANPAFAAVTAIVVTKPAAQAPAPSTSAGVASRTFNAVALMLVLLAAALPAM
jgi:hypothetical protein